jgi:hypothetical protein
MRKTLLRMLHGSFVVAVIVTAAVVMSSCYPNSPENTEEFDVVATFFNQDANFKEFSTFASRTDSIVQIQIKGRENVQLDHDNDDVILAHINDKLASRGYTREADPTANKPDMVVLVSSAATTQYDPYESDPWYSYWGSWFADSLGTNVDVSWGLDYQWYTGSVVYSYDVGSLMIMILDWRNVNGSGDENPPVLWLGSLNGLLSGSNVSTVNNRILPGIDQMFEQSPYLSKTGQ